MSTIGKRIHDRRIELGMSADDLARRLGKNRATVYRYESDEIENFPVAVIGPLSEALDVSPAYLMGWIEKEEPTVNKDDGLDELDRKLIDLLQRLTPDQKQLLLAQIQLMLSQNQ